MTSEIRLIICVVLLSGVFLSLPIGATAQFESAEAPAQSGWEVFPTNDTASLYTVDMVDANDGWAGGTSGLALHYDGTEWTSGETLFSHVFTQIDMVNASWGWGSTYQGVMVHYNGTQWVEGPNVTAGSLTGVSMIDGNDGWAIGFLGGIFRFQGGTWYEFQRAGYLLQAIDMVAPNDGWIVGRTGLTMHWNGSIWQVTSMPQNVWFLSVDMVTSDDGWAVGDGGVIYRYDGAAWSPVSSPTDRILYDVSMSSSTDGWAVGGEGTILHYDGQSWEAVQSPVTNNLHAVHMVAPDDGWIVGKNGVVLRYRGTVDLSETAKRASVRRANPGEQVAYTITARNSGNATAPMVVVTDPTPANATYVPGSATTSRGTISGVDPLVVDVGDLAPSEVATISLAVTVGDPGLACWFLKNEALIASTAMTVTRGVATPVGTCQTFYLPVVVRGHLR